MPLHSNVRIHLSRQMLGVLKLLKLKLKTIFNVLLETLIKSLLKEQHLNSAAFGCLFYKNARGVGKC